MKLFFIYRVLVSLSSQQKAQSVVLSEIQSTNGNVSLGRRCDFPTDISARGVTTPPAPNQVSAPPSDRSYVWDLTKTFQRSNKVSVSVSRGHKQRANQAIFWGEFEMINHVKQRYTVCSQAQSEYVRHAEDFFFIYLFCNKFIINKFNKSVIWFNCHR